MKNLGGKANIQLKKAVAGGKGTLTEVGLLELAQEKAQKPVFMNAGGQRNIVLKDFAAGGDKTVSNIGEMAMVNTKGTANISMMKAQNAGKGSVVNIGLLNLEGDQKPKMPLFNNEGGKRIITVKDLENTGDKSIYNIGEMAMDNSKGG